MHDKIRRSYQGNERPFFSLVSEKLGICKKARRPSGDAERRRWEIVLDPGREGMDRGGGGGGTCLQVVEIMIIILRLLCMKIL
jgi:hypothetical protein